MSESDILKTDDEGEQAWTDMIRELNDSARNSGPESELALWDLSPGVWDLRYIQRQAALRAVASANDFPWQANMEHDFGEVTVSGQVICWRIDYLDKANPAYEAQDPWDTSLTQRVIRLYVPGEWPDEPESKV